MAGMLSYQHAHGALDVLDAPSSSSSSASASLAAPPDLDVVTLRNAVTGTSVTLRARAVAERRAAALQRRVRAAEPVIAGDEAGMVVDWDKRTYSFARHPPLAFLLGSLWFVPLGALLIAVCAQIQFLFPCTAGYTSVTWEAASYCVPSGRVGDVTASTCPADICNKQIPVTMQTYAVLLNGALAGSTGWWATALYVLLVCLGAPFGAGGLVDPVWLKGAVVGPSGGYFWGFIAASWVMGRCAEKGHDRPRSLFWMVLWMFAAEGCIYAFGLFWLPFGLAIKAGVAPSAICPAAEGASSCLNNVFIWGFVPFVPGDIFKMLLVLITIPCCWQAMLMWHQRSTGYSKPGAELAAEVEAEAEASAAASSSAADATANVAVRGAAITAA